MRLVPSVLLLKLLSRSLLGAVISMTTAEVITNHAAGDLCELFLAQLRELPFQGFNFLFQGVQFFFRFRSDNLV